MEMAEGGDSVNWPEVLQRLRSGEAVDIPCNAEKDYIRRGQQAVKRTETRGMAVEVTRHDGFLRLQLQSEGGRKKPSHDSEEEKLSREARRAKKARRQVES